MTLKLEWAYPSKGVIAMNPTGFIAVCTCWTPPELVKAKIEEMALGGTNEHIAAIGRLYGRGLPIMLRNLAYNPQISRIIVYGKDFSGGAVHLANFFAKKFEQVSELREYRMDGLDQVLPTIRIEGDESHGPYVTDNLVSHAFWDGILPEVIKVPYGDLEALKRELERPNERPTVEERRYCIHLAFPKIDQRPSDIRGHCITARDMLMAWQEVLFRLFHFGRPVMFRGGKERQELLNVKVVIESPSNINYDALKKLGLTAQSLEDYANSLLSPETGEAPYTYGNRLMAHFGANLLEKVVADLALHRDDRRAFISLWDNTLDMDSPSAPCLLSLFFRKHQGALDMTASFRSHNGTAAWPYNAYGLGQLLVKVALKLGLEAGALTIFSHSLTMDLGDVDNVMDLIKEREKARYQVNLDPYGYYEIGLTTPGGCMHRIEATHYASTGEQLGYYTGNTAKQVCEKIALDEGVSDIGHALYLGRQLQMAEQTLKAQGWLSQEAPLEQGEAQNA